MSVDFINDLLGDISDKEEEFWGGGGGLRMNNFGLILISMSMKFPVKTNQRITKTNQTWTAKRRELS